MIHGVTMCVISKTKFCHLIFMWNCKKAPEIPLCMKMGVMWEKQEVLSGVSL